MHDWMIGFRDLPIKNCDKKWNTKDWPFSEGQTDMIIFESYRINSDKYIKSSYL